MGIIGSPRNYSDSRFLKFKKIVNRTRFRTGPDMNRIQEMAMEDRIIQKVLTVLIKCVFNCAQVVGLREC